MSESVLRTKIKALRDHVATIFTHCVVTRFGNEPVYWCNAQFGIQADFHYANYDTPEEEIVIGNTNSVYSMHVDPDPSNGLLEVFFKNENDADRFRRVFGDTSDKNETISRIHVTGRIGESATFVKDQLRNQAPGDGDYGWKGEIKNGKKWQSIFISPLRFGKAGVAIDPTSGKLGGQIYFFEKDRDNAMQLIKEAAREAVNAEIQKLQETLKTI